MKPEEFLDAYKSALATQDWRQVEPLIHPNCAVVFRTGTYKGIAEVEAAFRRNFSVIKQERYSVTEIDWVIKTDEFAVVLYNFEWAGVVDGKAASGSGRRSSTIVNVDGQWQLICEHLSPSS